MADLNSLIADYSKALESLTSSTDAGAAELEKQKKTDIANLQGMYEQYNIPGAGQMFSTIAKDIQPEYASKLASLTQQNLQTKLSSMSPLINYYQGEKQYSTDLKLKGVQTRMQTIQNKLGSLYSLYNGNPTTEVWNAIQGLESELTDLSNDYATISGVPKPKAGASGSASGASGTATPLPSPKPVSSPAGFLTENDTKLTEAINVVGNLANQISTANPMLASNPTYQAQTANAKQALKDINSAVAVMQNAGSYTAAEVTKARTALQNIISGVYDGTFYTNPYKGVY